MVPVQNKSPVASVSSLLQPFQDGRAISKQTATMDELTRVRKTQGAKSTSDMNWSLLFCFFHGALRQWRRGNIAMITPLPALDCLYSGCTICRGDVWGNELNVSQLARIIAIPVHVSHRRSFALALLSLFFLRAQTFKHWYCVFMQLPSSCSNVKPRRLRLKTQENK